MEQLAQSSETSDYLDAFLRMRTAKSWLMWLLLLALVLNLAICITVRCTSLLDRSAMFRNDLEELRGRKGAATTDRTPIDSRFAGAVEPPQNGWLHLTETAQPETAGADKPAEPPAPEAQKPAPTEPAARPGSETEKGTNTTVLGDVFYQGIHAALPLARVGGLLCGTLLVLILMLSLKVVLLGRLRGVGYLTSAVLWSLVLLVLLIPWNKAFAGFPIPSVLFGARELIEGTAQITWGAARVGWEDHLLYWMRFVGYPVLAVVLWLTITVQYARSYRPMVAGLQTEQESR